jgi:tetratricopeptide (TPR) repeat protein
MDNKKTIFFEVAAITLLTFFVYFPSLTNGFIWDDDDYITNNFSIQKAEGLREIWFSYKTPQYYPVVFSSFWLEHKLWGFNPTGYRTINLVFHVFNALLVYVILLKLYRPLALPAALIFAIHPVQVETVAWITERKNIFGAFFYLLTTFFYIRFYDSKRKQDYCLSLLSFVCALLSKSITSTFVIVPLLIRWWQGHKFRKLDFLQLSPFVLLGFLAGLNTVYLEIVRVGAEGSSWSLPLLGKIVLPGKIILFYLYKLVFPFELIFFYPRWHIDPSTPWQWLPIICVASILVLFYIYREKTGRAAFALFLCFVASLFPALGFFNVYPMMYSYVADHFQYIASISMIILLCAVAGFFAKRMVFERFAVAPETRQIAFIFALVIISSVLGFKTFSYSKAFENRETLFMDVIQKNPRAWMAHNNLGMVYISKGEVGKAFDQFQETLKIKPKDCTALNNLGNIYKAQGLWEKARSAYETCLVADPDYATAYNNLGLVHVHSGDLQQARELFEKAAALDPMAHNAHLNLGLLYLQQKEYGRSMAHYNKAIAIHPYYVEAYLQLGLLYAQTGRKTEAREAFEKVLAIDPQNFHAHNNLGILDSSDGQVAAALVHFREAVKLNPKSLQARYNLGEALLRLGQNDEARMHFREIPQAGYRLPGHIEKFMNSTDP